MVQKTGCPIIAVTKTRKVISNLSFHIRLGPFMDHSLVVVKRLT